jgi:hypothetical protein
MRLLRRERLRRHKAAAGDKAGGGRSLGTPGQVYLTSDDLVLLERFSTISTYLLFWPITPMSLG